MSTIKVTPEQLLYVSRQIEQGRQQLEGIRNDLTARIGFIQSQWAGATQERFFYDFQQSRSVLDRALESMVKSSQDLFAIAERFEQADQEQVSLGAVAGQIAVHTMMNHNISNTEEQRRMVYNPLFGVNMPASEAEDGMPGQKEFVKYWEQGGTYEEMRAGPKQPVSSGGDIYDEQISAFKEGHHPVTGESIPAWQAAVSIGGLQTAKLVLAFTGTYNRGYKVPKDGSVLSKSRLDGVRERTSSNKSPTPEHGTKLTKESTTVIGNSAVLNTMESKSKFYKKELAYDCSEIADDLAHAAGGRGEIFTIKSRTELKDIQVKEYGEMKSYVYHTVYSDGKYIYDPRLTSDPVPVKEYMDTVSRQNNGDIVVSKRTLK
ncbi:MULTISPECIES: WXG100 family type VII secretion target [Paenibacillus]|uniref:WXG100 family type VII secretion target n=1 Tax=Paenibacillus amylolyticus TaxID=1451 RepID=A0ABD8AVI4_PAEAM|nr:MULTISPECIES: WXG100 family type VII secretion target [Paenibacillus]ETT33146.1 hypothetical protein C161_21247 [Paenibacillus sp. FSL R5-192]ETT54933.1 hypothetical protein C170_03303 [Paenibacillus sp. FSL H7-689]MCZ1263173.1 WXG100 family type VII secretion target [Paenibacillus tundrae]OME95865.1 hypothetical protein BK124_19390 [Paenibacillus amylolyticus]SLK01702.1 WXG100 family type VII secretion target [Paenibacillus sp. RU5A]